VATPIGHLLLGGTIGAALSTEGRPWRGAAVGALAGMAADADFLPGLLMGSPARFHHAQSHSLLFVCVAAAVAAVAARQRVVMWSLVVGLAGASHLLLDWLTQDSSSPQGIPIFWPLTSRPFLCPVPLLPDVWRAPGHILSAHNAVLVALEMVLFAPPFLWALGKGRKRRIEGGSSGRGPG